jgi:energy-dependent translational throttle protein EttA
VPAAAVAPDLLLLDEPTNHLDAESVAWLERHLEEYPGTVVAVTHDRYFLDNVAGWILELDRGKGMPVRGQLLGWLEQKQERLRQEEKQESARQKTLAASSSGSTPPRRRGRPSPRPASRPTRPAGQGPAERQGTGGDRHPPRASGSATSSSSRRRAKGFGDRLLIEDLSFKLPPGGIVGVIGPNGAARPPCSG